MSRKSVPQAPARSRVPAPKHRLPDDPAGAITISLAENPAKVAADYGRLSGRCCFCKIELTDEKSIAVGYGPQCARSYGLPYGVQAMRDAQAKNGAMKTAV